MTWRGRAIDGLLVLAAALLPTWMHRDWLHTQGELPWEDVPGHLTILMRYYDALFGGGPLARDPYPPALYVVSSLCMRVLGLRLPVAEWGVVIYAGLLLAGMACLGLRLQGRAAAVLLPLLVASAPAIACYSRMFLLDVPAVALVPWILLAVWTSDGFRKPLPTFGLGLALALAILTKYNVVTWVLPLLAATLVWACVRDPLALLPLAFAAAPCAWVAARVYAAVLRAESALPLLGHLETVLAATGGTLVAGRLLAGRRAPGRWRRSLFPGFHLAIAAVGTVAAVLPWFCVASGTLLQMYTYNVVDHPHQGVHDNLASAWIDLHLAWPCTATWLAIGVAAALVEAVVRVPALHARARLDSWIGVDAARLPTLVLGVLLVASAATGAWFMASTLATNTRYYLPLIVFAALLVGVPITRLRPTRWVLAPLLGALCTLQILGAAGTLDLTRLTPRVYRVLGPADNARASAGARPMFYLPAAPRRPGLRAATERALDHLRPLITQPVNNPLPGTPARLQGQRCGDVAYAVTGPFEPRSLTALANVHGIGECVWRALDTTAGIAPRVLLFLGVQPDVASAAAAEKSVLRGKAYAKLYGEALSDGTGVSIWAW